MINKAAGKLFRSFSFRLLPSTRLRFFYRNGILTIYNGFYHKTLTENSTNVIISHTLVQAGQQPGRG